MQETKSEPLKKRKPAVTPAPQKDEEDSERSQGDFETERDLHNSYKRSNPGPNEEIDSPKAP